MYFFLNVESFQDFSQSLTSTVSVQQDQIGRAMPLHPFLAPAHTREPTGTENLHGCGQRAAE